MFFDMIAKNTVKSLFKIRVISHVLIFLPERCPLLALSNYSVLIFLLYYKFCDFCQISLVLFVVLKQSSFQEFICVYHYLHV